MILSTRTYILTIFGDKSMIIVKLIGGMGNQLFQYAIGRNLSLIHNTELKLDISLPQKPGERPYDLKYFNIQEAFATEEEIKELTFLKQSNLGKKIHHLFHKRPKLPKSYIRKRPPGFSPKTLDVPDNIYLDGYWQDERYFEPNADTIRNDLTFRNSQEGENKRLADIISNRQSICIHIRRGDYVDVHIAHGICNLDYYQKCIEAIAKQVKAPTFFVFSDDPQWCKDNLKLDFPTTYVNHNTGQTAYEDMRLMSQCKHNIIANSSFSWWGAWLNSNPEKIVYAPQKWFGTEKYKDITIVPNSWTSL